MKARKGLGVGAATFLNAGLD